jgi:Spy/CpxP family protein refolding chaperone
MAADDGVSGPFGMRHRGGMLRAIMEELNLSGDQKEQVRSILEAERQTLSHFLSWSEKGETSFAP